MRTFANVMTTDIVCAYLCVHHLWDRNVNINSKWINAHGAHVTCWIIKYMLFPTHSVQLNCNTKQNGKDSISLSLPVCYGVPYDRVLWLVHSKLIWKRCTMQRVACISSLVAITMQWNFLFNFLRVSFIKMVLRKLSHFLPYLSLNVWNEC